jgi:mannose-1-phosphate guanylyltransferase/mannose-6-phosphate isomerase
MLYGLIIAGGSGTRLWPLSRASLPKHLLPLHPSGRTLLCDTFARLARSVPAERIYIVTGSQHVDDALSQLRQIAPAFGRDHLLVEPDGRDSAPAVLWGMLHVHALDPQGSAAVVWSDHIIESPHVFDAALAQAARAAEGGALVAVGVRPTRPDTQLGYIRYAPEALHGAHRAQRFIEKPDAATARKLLEEGHCVWNAGIFVFHAGTLVGEFRRLAPEIFGVFERHDRPSGGPTRWAEPDTIKAIYADLPKGSLDYLVLEKTDRLYVVPAELEWNDVGTWDAVWREAPKDGDGNSVSGPVVTLGAHNCLIRAGRRLVTVVGARELVIVDSNDALLVCDLGHTDQVRQLVEQLKKLGRKEVHGADFAVRPWGTYAVLWEGPGFKVKELQVNPGQRLSLQMHRHRSEHWVVTEGQVLLTRADEVKQVGPDGYMHIPAGVKHRIENPGQTRARMIEVQSGEYVGEDDIVRFDDVYGRA